MKIGALSFCERGTSNGDPAQHWVLAAWHWRWSITWRWLLWWAPVWYGWKPVAYSFNGGYGGHVLVRMPLVGEFYFAWQKNMPWKKRSDDIKSEER